MNLNDTDIVRCVKINMLSIDEIEEVFEPDQIDYVISLKDKIIFVPDEDFGFDRNVIPDQEEIVTVLWNDRGKLLIKEIEAKHFSESVVCFVDSFRLVCGENIKYMNDEEQKLKEFEANIVQKYKEVKAKEKERYKKEVDGMDTGDIQYEVIGYEGQIKEIEWKLVMLKEAYTKRCE